ncbi:MAG TPA: zinc-ribbon domain-containing protein, partial [Gaiellaceae bacterium]|nr:zinc-ribbon domain-containing protein [Gaiellaceae bacterium]
MTARECMSCRALVPADARFCPACGRPLAQGAGTWRPEPRLFGVLPAGAALLAAFLLGVGGAVSLTAERWPAAVLLLSAAAALLVLSLGTERRRPRLAAPA